MTSRLALFRFDASPEIGGGHAVRCLALAHALSKRGWNCRFLVAEGTTRAVPALKSAGFPIEEGERHRRAAPISADLVVVDHYRLDAEWERDWRSQAAAILVIDDLADRRHHCDILLDQGVGRRVADYRGLVPAGCRLLLGLDYALLRPEFARLRPAALARRDDGRVDRILIAPGATDPTNLAGWLLDGAERIRDAAIDIAIGGAAPFLPTLRRRASRSSRIALHVDTTEMAALMSAADLCLGAAGGTSWERCCLGLPTVAAAVSPDQRAVAAALESAGAARMVTAGDTAALNRAVAELACDGQTRRAMSRSAAGLCDGAGARRVAALLDRAASEYTIG